MRGASPPRGRGGAVVHALALALGLLAASSASAVEYFYDELDRLVRVVYEDGTEIEYGYDAGGNRLTRRVSEDRDGDGVGYAGGAQFCSGGETSGCEDNCPTIGNPDQADQDGDGVGDACDTCVEISNPRMILESTRLTGNQLDGDQDGFGNACDADLNGDGVVDFLDLGLLKDVFFTDDAVADLNGDGVVDFLDLGTLKDRFFQPPGPKCDACPLENLP